MRKEKMRKTGEKINNKMKENIISKILLVISTN